MAELDVNVLMAEAMAKAHKMREENGYEKNGKKYLDVKDRLEIFRGVFGHMYGIDTNVTFNGYDVLATAKIMRDQFVMASGHAMVVPSESGYSPVETAETKAIGRALACLGLHGGEYPSSAEMISVREQGGAVDKKSDTGEDAYRDMPPKERAFREEVDKHFPPSVNKFEFFIPVNNSSDEIDQVFAEIDRIKDNDTLSAYWTALEETMQWMKPGEISELKASFQSRSRQLKG